MKVAELPEPRLAALLKRGELLVDCHPFVAAFRSDVPSVAQGLAAMYGEFGVAAADTFVDFRLEVSHERRLRRWVKPLARFYFDDLPSFTPLPAAQAFPMMEWGLNWCVAAHAHQYLVVHAAVVEKNGRAAVLPAPPGSGKSTLCAGLVQRGWRLLSDELALCSMETGLLCGMSRPISLKNASIDAIRRFAPDVVMTPPVPDTTKGTVSLLRPPAASVQRRREPARPAWIVLPRFVAGAPAALVPHNAERCFMLLAEQSFNYDIHGARGFDAVAALVDRCARFSFVYGDLDDAVRVFDELAAAPPA